MLNDYMEKDEWKKHVANKVDVPIFKKQVERLDKQLTILEVATEVKLPAIENSMKQELSKRAKQDWVEEMLELKVDKDMLTDFNERLIKNEELIEQISKKQQEKEEQE